MKKIALFWASMILLVCLMGCSAENRQISPPVPSESGTTQNLPLDSMDAWEITSPMQSAPPDASVNRQETGSILESSEENLTMRISVKSKEYEILYELNDSQAARELYEQLPLTTEVEPFNNNEMTFYPPEKLHTTDTPLSSGEAGTLSYYAPWGDVVMFYDTCKQNGSLYELGTAISGADDIAKLTGSIAISVYE